MNANHLNLEGMAFDKSGELIVKTTMNAGKKERKFSHDHDAFESGDKFKDGRKSFTGSTGYTIDQENSSSFVGKC